MIIFHLSCLICSVDQRLIDLYIFLPKLSEQPWSVPASESNVRGTACGTYRRQRQVMVHVSDDVKEGMVLDHTFEPLNLYAGAWRRHAVSLCYYSLLCADYANTIVAPSLLHNSFFAPFAELPDLKDPLLTTSGMVQMFGHSSSYSFCL